MLADSLKTKLVGAVIDCLAPAGSPYGYRDTAGRSIDGQALSFLVDEVSSRMRLRYAHSRRRALISEDDLEAAGFRIVDGRNHRNQRCRIVTL